MERVEVRNAVGQLVSVDATVNQRDVVLNLQGVQAGVYTVTLRAGEASRTERLIDLLAV